MPKRRYGRCGLHHRQVISIISMPITQRANPAAFIMTPFTFSQSRSRQRGNGLVFALLGLALTSFLALATTQRTIAESDRVKGGTEATVQLRVAKAVNDFVAEYQTQLKSQLSIPAGTATLAPIIDAGVTTYVLTIENLKALNALPDNWNSTTSPVNGGAYSIRLRLLPAGCLPAACGVDGDVQNLEPFLASDNSINAAAIGLFMTQVGVDSGVTFAGSSASVTGFGNTWNAPNRATGTPAGLLATRVGTAALGFAPWLRPRDLRDPDFQGGTTISGLLAASTYTLVVNGNANITGTLDLGQSLNVGGTATFNGPVVFNNGIDSDILLRDPATGVVCVRILRLGQIDINCAGRLNASRGTFTGPLGTVNIGDTGTNFTVDATGRVRGSQGFYSAVGSVFGDNTLGIRAAGTALTFQTSAAVDAVSVEDTGRLGSRNSLASPILGLTDPVAAGSPCTLAGAVPSTLVTTAATTVIRATVGGGFATCSSGAWTPVVTPGTVGGFCATNGSLATSPTGSALYCSGNTYVSLADRFGSLVPAETILAADSSVVPKPLCASGSSGSRLVMTPGNEQQKTQFVNRYLSDNGASWTVFFRDGANVPIPGDFVTLSYCIY